MASTSEPKNTDFPTEGWSDSIGSSTPESEFTTQSSTSTTDGIHNTLRSSNGGSGVLTTHSSSSSSTNSLHTIHSSTSSYSINFISSIVNSVKTTQYTSSTISDPGGNDSNIGAIVGGVIGLLVLMALVVLIIFLVIQRDRLSQLCKKDPEEVQMDDVNSNSKTKGYGDEPTSPKHNTEINHEDVFANETPAMQPHESQMQLVTHEPPAKSFIDEEQQDDTQLVYTNMEVIQQHNNSRPASSKHSSHHSNTNYAYNNDHHHEDSIPSEYAPDPQGTLDDIYDHPTASNEGVMDEIYDHPKYGTDGYRNDDTNQSCDSMPVELAPFPYQTQDQGVFDDIYDHPPSGKNHTSGNNFETEEEEGIFDDIYDRPKGGITGFIEENCDSIPQDFAPVRPQTQDEGYLDNEGQEGVFDDIYDHPKGNQYIDESLDSIPQENAPHVPITTTAEDSDSDEYDYPKQPVKFGTLPSQSYEPANKPVPKARTLPVNSQYHSSASHEHVYGNVQY